MRIKRQLETKVRTLWEKFPIITITGPRQSGKTTLIKMLDLKLPYVTLEDLDIRGLALSDPRGFLSNYPDGAILDEVQQAPNLFSYLQTAVDGGRARYLLSGSQNFQLLESISQSLAGRAAIFKLLPFSMTELRDRTQLMSYTEYIFKGSYPRLYDQDIAPSDFYPYYIQTYIQRDVRMIKNIENLETFTRFLRLCAGRIGQPFNASNLANDAGISPKTAQAWISILQASYILYLLPPYYRNYSKRLVKARKLYFYDTGVACALLGIEDTLQVDTHFLIGGLFENMVINELLKQRFNSGKDANLYYWQNRNRQEVDIIIDDPVMPIAIEIKAGQTYDQSYFDNLKYFKLLSDNNRLAVIYGGDQQVQTSVGGIYSWKDLVDVPSLVRSIGSK